VCVRASVCMWLCARAGLRGVCLCMCMCMCMRGGDDHDDDDDMNECDAAVGCWCLMFGACCSCVCDL
jgi:hypothetical protein